MPAKALGAAKSRLLPHLGRDAVARLALAMLGDLLATLGQVTALSRVAVVTPDGELAEAARRAGAEALLRPDPGLNPAVEAAAAELAPDPAEGALVVLGDVAGALPEEIEQLLGAVEGRGVALAPSSDGGSSALVRLPRDLIPAGFGPGSAKVHRDLAARAGAPFREVPLPSLAIDVDEPADLEAFLARPGGGARTRALLRELGVGQTR
ncbi:MAG: 2-phospho-L-lactate guanylyltransferase [Myxococcota bacterium]